jgi:hypothetical protein
MSRPIYTTRTILYCVGILLSLMTLGLAIGASVATYDSVGGSYFVGCE